MKNQNHQAYGKAKSNPSISLTWEEILKKSQADRSRAGWHVAQFLKLVDEHFKKEHSVRFYAKMLPINADHLRQACKKVLNMPPRCCIASRLVFEAGPLIVNNHLTIGELSFMLGYKTQSHFDHIFKKHTGLNPTDFRESAWKSN